MVLRLWRQRRMRQQSGAAAVEFALVMLPLLYLVLGVIQYSLYFYSMQAGTSAVGDGVRRLSVGECQNNTDLQNLLSSRLGSGTTASASALAPSVIYTKVNPDGSTSPTVAPGVVGGSVQLSLAYPVLDMHFPFLPLPSHAVVTSSLTARVEDTAATPGGCS